MSDELAVVERVSSTDLDRAARLGMWLAAAESNSNDAKARGMAAALRIQYAESLGLPAHAAQEIHLIRGNLTLSAKLCRALAHNHGLRVVRVEETAESCTAAVVRDDGRELGRTTYTLAQAKKAGLSGTNWQSNTDRMLWARASKRALDDHAPWVTVGVLIEEDFTDDVAPAAPQPFDGDEVLEGELVEELGGEPDDAKIAEGAHSGVVHSVVAHDPESSPSDESLFTEMARKQGLVG